MQKGYQEHQVQEYFQKHDKNGDGKLDYSEFTTFYDVPIFVRWVVLQRILVCTANHSKDSLLSGQNSWTSNLTQAFLLLTRTWNSGCVWVKLSKDKTKRHMYVYLQNVPQKIGLDGEEVGTPQTKELTCTMLTLCVNVGPLPGESFIPHQNKGEVNEQLLNFFTKQK